MTNHARWWAHRWRSWILAGQQCRHWDAELGWSITLSLQRDRPKDTQHSMTALNGDQESQGISLIEAM
ncbi:MAG: hypothetical protein AAFY42_11155, partial [Pseudomonadota bacterium]